MLAGSEMRPLSHLNKEYLIEKLKVLKRLKFLVFAPFFSGICRQLGGDVLVALISPHWPKYSGFTAYPVPHPTKSSMDGYHDCLLWNYFSEYGQNRRELVRFMIAHIEYELSLRSPEAHEV